MKHSPHHSSGMTHLGGSMFSGLPSIHQANALMMQERFYGFVAQEIAAAPPPGIALPPAAPALRFRFTWLMPGISWFRRLRHQPVPRVLQDVGRDAPAVRQA